MKGDDFTSTPLTATIPAGATSTIVRVPVMSDNIVEGDEMFSMSLTVPPSLGPGIVAGTVTSATGIIVDSTGKDFFNDGGLYYIGHRNKNKIQRNTIHWFRRYRICASNIGTKQRNIQ